MKPSKSFTSHNQLVQTYICEHCHRPVRYTIQQYRLGNGKFMPAGTENPAPPQCTICGTTPTDFRPATDPTASLVQRQGSFVSPSMEMRLAMSFGSLSADGSRSAECLVIRAENAGPGGNRMLDAASYTTCQTHLEPVVSQTRPSE